MHRKNYVGIAKAISEANKCLKDYRNVPEVVAFWEDYVAVLGMELCRYFQDDNDNFDTVKFMDAIL